MIRRVSTTLCNSAMPDSAVRIRRMPSKWNGLVTTPTVRMPISRAVRAITGAAPVPVPPPMPAVTNTMLAPVRWSRSSSMTSCAAAAPTSGCEPAPRPCVTAVPICTMRCAFDMVSACASVLATTKSTPCNPAVIMLLTALPPAPPTPKTVIRGFSSLMSGGVRLSAMVASLTTRALVHPGRRPRGLVKIVWLLDRSSEALAKPSSDLSEIAVSPCPELPRMPRFDVFQMSVLRIDQQAGRHRERGALGLAGQPAEAERTADPDRPVENPGGEFDRPGQLGRPAAQDNPRPRFCRKGGIREPVPDHFKNLLGAMPDDIRDRGARDDLRSIVFLPCGRNRHQLARVRPAGQHGPV